MDSEQRNTSDAFHPNTDTKTRPCRHIQTILFFTIDSEKSTGGQLTHSFYILFGWILLHINPELVEINLMKTSEINLRQNNEKKSWPTQMHTSKKTTKQDAWDHQGLGKRGLWTSTVSTGGVGQQRSPGESNLVAFRFKHMMRQFYLNMPEIVI